MPRFSPNLVTTTFAANALLDAHELGAQAGCLGAAVSSGQYIVNELYWSDAHVAAFGYPVADNRVPVHNANLMGAALLCRLAKITGSDANLEIALRVTRFAAQSQRADGSWLYGTASTQAWIDNFHTGYNLCSLQSIIKDTGTREFDDVLAKGITFYVRHFFRVNGAPQYFHDRTYPIDIHSAAQSIITLTAVRGLAPDALELRDAVLRWTVRYLWDRQGYFYYRRLRHLTIRTSYMRWSQAWMLLALSVYAGDTA